MSLASSIALIAVLAVALGSLPGIVFVFTYAPSFNWRYAGAAIQRAYRHRLLRCGVRVLQDR